MILPLFRSGSRRRIAAGLYAAVVAQARYPVFYRDLGVPDTIEGRYEMIVLHLALLLRRLGAPGAGQAQLSQALVDFMAADLDRSMRELGIGDLSVGRYMKRLGEGLYGRAFAYGEALDRIDAGAGSEMLASALLRNLYDGVDPGRPILAAISDYVELQENALRAQPIEAIAGGKVAFPMQGCPLELQ